MSSDEEKLAKLRRQYGAIIANWLSANKKNPRFDNQYEFFSKANEMLCGSLKPSKKYKVESLEQVLVRLFGSNEIIVLDSDDEDVKIAEKPSEILPEAPKDDVVNVPKINNIKARRQSICVPSISTYAIKTQKLTPASAYAKNSKTERLIVSVNYKETKPINKSNYDPVKEAIKIKNIKEKIYCKQFLNVDLEEKNEIKEKDGYTSESEQQKPKKVKLRPRSKSMYFEAPPVYSDSEGEKFDKIPILKTRRPVKRGRSSKINLLI